jgi:hypothetical protein
VVIRKLTGNSVSWKIKVGHGDKAKLFDSAKIKGEVYGSLDEVRAIMTKRLNEYIDKISLEAQERVEKWYGKEIADRERQQQSQMTVPSPPSVDDRIDPDILLSTIENGPPSPKFTPDATAMSADPKRALKSHLTSLAIPSPEEDLESGEGETFIQGPNGERIRVRMPKPKMTLS